MSTLAEHLRAGRAGIEARHAGLLHGNPHARRVGVALCASAAAVYLLGLILLDVSPVRLWQGAGRLLDIASLMMPPAPHAWSRFWIYFHALGQTLSIALLGTSAAAVFAFPFGFLAAKNVLANRVLHVLARRGLDTIRSVDTLIWALIWINVVGLGPFAGALAIACADFGALSKLVSEAVETADRRAGEGVMSCGGGPVAVIRFGIVPQILPVFASQLLYFFESNVRSATIIGIVGAGGIGLYLYEQIRILEWQEAAFIILMVLATVAVIDAFSQRLRGAMIGARR